MNFKNYLKTYNGAISENKWNRILVGILLCTNVLLAIFALNKTPIVTMQPVTLSEESWIAKNDASISYKESWGHYLATILGNVTPANVTFIKERISPLLAPKIYGQVIEVLEIQSAQIINDKVSIRFEPRLVAYEKKSNKVFVTGYSFMKTFNSKEQKTERTYEFIIDISNYLPIVRFIDVYSGQPKTKEVLERLMAKEQEKKNAR